MSAADRLRTAADMLAAELALAATPMPVTDLGTCSSLFAARYEREALELTVALHRLQLMLAEASVLAVL